jgi:hypothetical protein
MKRAANLPNVAALVISLSFLSVTSFASSIRGSGAVSVRGEHASGFSDTVRGGFRGGFSGRFFSGFQRGGFAASRRHLWLWSDWYPSSYPLACVYPPPPEYYTYVYAPPPMYVSPPLVYSADIHDSRPAVIYASPLSTPLAENTNPSVVDRPVPTIAGRESQLPSTPQREYSPQKQLQGEAEVRALVKAGVSEKIILNQIRNSRVVYHLTAAEIIDLKESGVSERVIDFIISSAPTDSSANDLRFKLTGVMSAPEGGLVAVVNGKVVVEKNYVDGAIVKKIDLEQVTLDLNGHEFAVRL